MNRKTHALLCYLMILVLAIAISGCKSAEKNEAQVATPEVVEEIKDVHETEEIDEMEEIIKSDTDGDRIVDNILVEKDDNIVIMTYPQKLAENKNFINFLNDSMGDVKFETFINANGTVSYTFLREHQQELQDESMKVMDGLMVSVPADENYSYVKKLYLKDDFRELVMEISEEDEKDKALAAGLIGYSVYLKSVIYQGISEVETEDMHFKVSIATPSSGVIRGTKEYSIMDFME